MLLLRYYHSLHKFMNVFSLRGYDLQQRWYKKSEWQQDDDKLLTVKKYRKL